MSDTRATTDHDERVIAALDFAADTTDHKFGGVADEVWLLQQIGAGPSSDKLAIAVEIAVALMHRVIDLKRELAEQKAGGYLRLIQPKSFWN